jgi:hypothetical protein
MLGGLWRIAEGLAVFPTAQNSLMISSRAEHPHQRKCYYCPETVSQNRIDGVKDIRSRE